MHRVSLLTVLPISILIAAAFFMAPGCNSSNQATATSEQTAEVPSAPNESPSQAGVPDEDHGHKPGAHGGNIVSLGRDSYHVEAVFEKGGTLRLYTLGQDESRVIDVEKQTLKGFAKGQGDTEAQPFTLEAVPQDGDADGRTSQFVGTLPMQNSNSEVEITVPNIVISGERFRLGFKSASESHDEEEGMPNKVADDEERQLYLTPGGSYTEQDIRANGGVTASVKFKGIKSAHDMFPKEGDKICPITKTKANPKFSWVIGGKAYEFCCPPCVDEFIKTAKATPTEIKDPSEYVKR